MDVLAAIVADIHAQKPDHIAMTGDILNIGLKAEFPLAAAWLETLGPADKVSFVPGNHDAYTRGSMPHVASTLKWTTSDASGESGFPYLTMRNGVALIGLSSGIPTAPFLASGRLGSKQRARFDALLADLARQKLTARRHGAPSAESRRRRRGDAVLSDRHEFEEIVTHRGAHLVIHGHNHRMTISYIDEHARIPVVGVQSASASGGSRSTRTSTRTLTPL